MDKTEAVTSEPNETGEPTPKRTYGSHVSRVLGAAGFTRGETESSSLGNMNYYTPGFVVRGCNQSWEWGYLTDDQRDAGYVTVERSIMDTHRHEADDPRSREERIAEDLNAYTTALESAGFVVERGTRSYKDYLVVTGRIR